MTATAGASQYGYLAQYGDDAAKTGGGLIFVLFALAFVVLYIAALWTIFKKAGEPGWAAVIPIYNTIVMLRIIGRPWWWILLFLIPIVNFVLLIIVSVDLAKSFGKGVGFGIGLLLLGFIFYPLLGFGRAQYAGPSASPRPVQ